MGKIKENWLVLVLAMLLTLVGNMAFYSIKNTDVTLKNAASRDYVDKGDAKLDAKIDKQGKGLEEKKADKATVKEIQETLKIIDGRIYDIWKDSHENI